MRVPFNTSPNPGSRSVSRTGFPFPPTSPPQPCSGRGSFGSPEPSGAGTNRSRTDSFVGETRGGGASAPPNRVELICLAGGRWGIRAPRPRTSAERARERLIRSVELTVGLFIFTAGFLLVASVLR